MLRRSTSVAIVVFALTLFITGQVLAVGPGLGLGGNAKLHPYLDVEGRYNSNVNNLADNAKGDFILSFHPGLDLAVPASFIDLRLDGKFGYSRYFGLEDSRLKRNVLTGNAGLDLTINPKGAFQLKISDSFQRTEEPRDYVVSYLAGRYGNLAKAIVIVQPGGGALRIGAGYGFDFSYYDSDSGLKAASNQSHNFYFDTRWRFLPKTSFMIHFNMALLDYPYKGANFQDIGGKPLNAWIGLSGLLTRSLAFNVHVGYGDSLLDKGTGFRNAIAEVEILQRFPTNTTISGGYNRDFRAAHLFRYYGEDRVFLKISQSLLDDKLDLSAKVGYAYIAFGAPVQPTSGGTSPGSRYDSRVRINASINYDILKFLSLNVQYMLVMDITDYEWKDTTLNVTTPAKYNNHQAWLSIIFHY